MSGLYSLPCFLVPGLWSVFFLVCDLSLACCLVSILSSVPGCPVYSIAYRRHNGLVSGLSSTLFWSLTYQCYQSPVFWSLAHHLLFFLFSSLSFTRILVSGVWSASSALFSGLWPVIYLVNLSMKYKCKSPHFDIFPSANRLILR